MSKQAPAPAPEAVANPEDRVATLSSDAVAPFEGYLAAIPDAEGGGYESILAQIDAAGSAKDLDAAWRTAGLEQYRDQLLRVHALRKMPSDFAGGLAWFLVVDAVDLATGERVTFTTGAIGVVAQLVKAFALGALPLQVIPRESERTTRAGYHVWHLEVVA